MLGHLICIILLIISLVVEVSSLERGMSANETRQLRDKALEMFDHAYSSYMVNAFPADELMPLTCQGRFRGNRKSRGDIDESLGNFTLTLVDTLDTLALLGKLEEFETAVHLVIEHTQFDTDVVVSVFETNIRMLGGLLGGHVTAVDLKKRGKCCQFYERQLLDKALDLGERLLPAFDTDSGIPYPKVNLRSGMKGLKIKDTCTACAGTMVLEFAALSRLSGDNRFENAAHKAMDFLWKQRNVHSDLMGTVLNIQNGDWVRREASIGAGIDSYYEYLLKAYILLGDDVYLQRFNKHYSAIMRYLNQGPLMLSVDMHKPSQATKHVMDALLAFWPGLQVLKGDLKSAIEMHEVLYQITQRHNFLPEAVTTDFHVHWAQHPLRPEFLESTYFLYKATNDPHYRDVGKSVLLNLEKHARVPCGFSAIKDVRAGTHEDQMDSFVLAETFKYLYLLFEDEANLVIDIEQYIFTTEAHLLPLSLANQNFPSGQKPPVNPPFSDPNDSSCPNVREINQLSTVRYAQMLRLPLKNYVELKCPKPRQLKPPRLRATDFQPGSADHAAIIKRMGIVLAQTTDGRVQLVHVQNQAESPELAEEGLAFMKEMISLAEDQQEQIQIEPRVVQVLPSPGRSSLVFTSGAAQFGYKFSESNSLPRKYYQGGVRATGVVVEPFDACEEIENREYLAGRIALAERGSCTFVQKARNVQQHGAVGLVVIDTTADSTVESSPLFQMSGEGDDSDLIIPTMFLYHKEGSAVLTEISRDRQTELYLGTKRLDVSVEKDDGEEDAISYPRLIYLIDGVQTNVFIEDLKFQISLTLQSGAHEDTTRILEDRIEVDIELANNKPLLVISVAQYLDFTEVNARLPNIQTVMVAVWRNLIRQLEHCRSAPKLRHTQRDSIQSYLTIAYDTSHKPSTEDTDMILELIHHLMQCSKPDTGQSRIVKPEPQSSQQTKFMDSENSASYIVDNSVDQTDAGMDITDQSEQPGEAESQSEESYRNLHSQSEESISSYRDEL